MRIRLSASQIIAHDNCSFQHYLQSVLRVKTQFDSANKVFGKCIDLAIREFLMATALGSAVPDSVETFMLHWKQERASKEIVYACTIPPESLEKTGIDLMRLLPDAWLATGYQVAVDQDGAPLVDRRVSRVLGQRSGIEVEIDGVLDVLVYDREGALGILDAKSSAAEHTEVFCMRSDQLTHYDLLVRGHHERLGLPRPEFVGFWDLLKRKASSRVVAPIVVPSRSDVELNSYVEKAFWIAEDIARKRYPKQSRHQFNSPCEMCDFSRYCVSGDREGLIFPDSKLAKTA